MMQNFHENALHNFNQHDIQLGFKNLTSSEKGNIIRWWIAGERKNISLPNVTKKSGRQYKVDTIFVNSSKLF